MSISQKDTLYRALLSHFWVKKIISKQSLCVYLFLLWISASGAVAANFVNSERLEFDPVFDGQVFVHEVGDPSNEHLVLVHGLGDAASKDWQQTIDALKKDYYIITLDLPGFGQSSKGSKDYTPTKYATLIKHITSKYSLRPFHLVGHSMGGAIALRYIEKYPNDVKTLTLINTAGLLHRLAYTKFLAPIGLETLIGFKIPGDDKISTMVGTIMSKLERKLPIDIEFLVGNSMMRNAVLKGNPSTIAALGLVMEDFSEALAQVTVATLIIWGDKDDIAPIRTGYVLNSMIADSEMRVISGAGHVPIKNNFKAYISYLKDHLHGNLEKTIPKRHKPKERQDSLSCYKQKSAYYTGNIGQLTIKSCKNVVIDNAFIKELVIDRSRVIIKNTHIASDNIAINANRSTIDITAGSISGHVAIKTTAGKYDIAGTKIMAKGMAIEASRTASFIFSLSSINSKPIHGLKTISSKRPLLLDH